MTFSDYKQLEVRKKSIHVVVEVYKLLPKFPPYELYALADQIRRASTSIPSNIAEGLQRIGKDRTHFLRIAKGSAAELETQVILALKLGYIDTIDEILDCITQIHKMIRGLMHV